MIPAAIYDNFWEDPDAVRNYALSLNYTKHPGAVPGFRSEKISELNPELFDSFQMMLINLLYGAGDYDAGIDAYFQWVPEKYEEGWVHTDNAGAENDPTIAGVIYLTPDAPINAGTSVYKKTITSDMVSVSHGMKTTFYQDEPIDMSYYRMNRDLHNSRYEKTIDVSNVYNRLFVYNTTQLHRENKFFGKTIEDSRLILVFFGKVERIND